ncbi:MAG TPA: phosphoribosylamine--glycine ligase [Acidimicrobiales bacterium]|nr:phosphoribosylamine--glycine ligase [Acidimicrobiales bacterium]
MKVLVIGAGAREHALAEALARTADVVVAPGNDGIPGQSAEGHEISTTAAPPEEIEADLVVVGPEAPLVEGLGDRLRARGMTVLGPGADGARLEGSKAFMKQVAAAAHVPTARFAVFDQVGSALEHLRRTAPPYVIKTDGLAAGKGVLVTPDLEQAEADVTSKLTGESFGRAGTRVVIEEAMTGEELSLLALCDGTRSVPLPIARDYKRVNDGEKGPNTGGMGAHSPVGFAPQRIVEEAMERIVEPTLVELRRRGIDYRGVLYAGLMLTDDGVRLVEFNVRLGDPEAEVVLPRVAGDVTELFYEVASGRGPREVATNDGAAVCVVMATKGYPGPQRHGDVITGLEQANAVPGVSVFHAGSKKKDGDFVTDGGRVFAVTAVAGMLAEARGRAYEAVHLVQFDGAQFRGDIAMDVREPASRGVR